MTIAILGAGALGCAIGAALTGAGQDVWLIGRPGAQLDALRRDGLLVEGAPGRRTPPAPGRPATTLPVRATADAAEIGPVDLVIVLVKSFQTQAAMTAALPLVGPDTAVLSLQNGLGHEELLAEVVGREHVLLGSTFAGGVLLGPGHVRAETAGRRTWIGEPTGPATSRVRRIAATLTAAGLHTSVSDDMATTRWNKLLVNVATGAIAAITGPTYGQLAEQPLLLDTSAAAVSEAMAVAAASGVRLSTDDPRDVWRQATEGLSGDFKTSMLQSLERGRPTEIDVINGAVVRFGARHGVPTPVNATLVALVRGLERALDERQKEQKERPA